MFYTLPNHTVQPKYIQFLFVYHSSRKLAKNKKLNFLLNHRNAHKVNKTMLQEANWRIVNVNSWSCIKEMQFLSTCDGKDFSRSVDNLEKYSSKREVSVASDADR